MTTHGVSIWRRGDLWRAKCSACGWLGKWEPAQAQVTELGFAHAVAHEALA